jgi:hypothetical protein
LVYNRPLIPYVVVVIDVEPIRERFSTVVPFLDERGRRLVAAAEAFAAGSGGIAVVAMATGMAPSTIGRGLKELAQEEPSKIAAINIKHGEFHGEWNYTISPNTYPPNCALIS